MKKQALRLTSPTLFFRTLQTSSLARVLTASRNSAFQASCPTRVMMTKINLTSCSWPVPTGRKLLKTSRRPPLNRRAPTARAPSASPHRLSSRERLRPIARAPRQTAFPSPITAKNRMTVRVSSQLLRTGPVWTSTQ